MGKDVAVLDVGSHKLVFVVGRKTPTGVYSTNFISCANYDGFYDGDFCSPDYLIDDVKELVSSCTTKMPKCLYVSVPSEFTRTSLNSFLINNQKEKLVTNQMVDEVHHQGDDYVSYPNYELISSSAIEYELDGRKCYTSPVGERAQIISATVSYTLVDKRFIQTFDYIAQELGFKETGYIPSQIAIGSNFVDETARSLGAISLDVGFCTSSIAILKGEGVVRMDNMSFGFGTIFAALAEKLKVSFDDVLELESKINLNYAASDGAVYTVLSNNAYKTYKAVDVNNAIIKELDELVDFINESIKLSSIISDTTPIYITGGGVCGIKGAIMYLEKKLNRRIRAITVEIPHYNKPCFSSVFAVLDVACDINQSKSFWNKLF